MRNEHEFLNIYDGVEVLELNSKIYLCADKIDEILENNKTLFDTCEKLGCNIYLKQMKKIFEDYMNYKFNKFKGYKKEKKYFKEILEKGVNCENIYYLLNECDCEDILRKCEKYIIKIEEELNRHLNKNSEIEKTLEIADKAIDIVQENIRDVGAVYYDEFIENLQERIIEIIKDKSEALNDINITQLEKEEIEENIRDNVYYEFQGIEIFECLDEYFTNKEINKIENEFKEYLNDKIMQTKYDLIELKEVCNIEDNIEEYNEKINILEDVLEKIKYMIKGDK